MDRKEEIYAANPYSYSSYIEYGKRLGFFAGAEWADAHPKNPWISVEDRSTKMPNDKPCLLMLENGAIVRYDEEWEDDYPLTMATHWMPIVEPK